MRSDASNIGPSAKQWLFVNSKDSLCSSRPAPSRSAVSDRQAGYLDNDVTSGEILHIAEIRTTFTENRPHNLRSLQCSYITHTLFIDAVWSSTSRNYNTHFKIRGRLRSVGGKSNGHQFWFMLTNSVESEPEFSSSHSQQPATGPYPEPIESTPHPQPIFQRPNLIPSSHLCLRLRSRLSRSDFPTKTFCTLSPLPHVPHVPPTSSPLTSSA
jgi:hypothetical protein